MEQNREIQNYLEYLERKSDRELQRVVKAMKCCRECRGDRKAYYVCLVEQGISLRQIGILEGVSRQAISKRLA